MLLNRDYKYVGHADSITECLAGARKENATYAIFNAKQAKVPGAYNCNGIYNFKGGCVMPVRPCLLSSAFASIASAISTCTDELVRIWWLGIKSVRTQGWDGYTVSTGEKKALC